MFPIVGFNERVSSLWDDDRLTANLLALACAWSVILVVWLGFRYGFHFSLAQFRRWIRWPWFDGLAPQLEDRGQLVLWWIAVASTALSASGGIVYHVIGGDIQQELESLYAGMTPQSAARVCVQSGLTAILMFVLWFSWKGVAGQVGGLLAGIQRKLEICGEEGEKLLSQAEWTATVSAKIALLLGSLALGGSLWSQWPAVKPGVMFGVRVTFILAGTRCLLLFSRAIAVPCYGWGERTLSRTWFRHYWEQLVRLGPLGHKCFEMAISITATIHAVNEFDFIQLIAHSGSKIVACIGLYFGTRVLIEFLQVLLNESFGLYHPEPRTSQQARTLVPLLHSMLQYVTYFGALIYALKIWELPTEPIVAGAGIIGLAVGLGAQNLVNDVVSGLFILFENQYLVGDYIEIGNARGVVEAVAVRHTQIRDDQGKLHLIPNGQIKEVISHSKGFMQAVVEVHIPAGANVEHYLWAMKEAGKKLKQSHPEVLSETQIQGALPLGNEASVARALTKVKPGTNWVIENEYRRLLKPLLESSPSVILPRAA